MNRNPYKAIIAILGLAGIYLLVSTVMEKGYLLPKVEISDVGQPQEIEIEAPSGKAGIYAIEILFSGELSEDAAVLITYPGAPVRVRKFFKAGKINDRYYGEWFYDRFILSYEPQGVPEGHLTIRYRFVHQ